MYLRHVPTEYTCFYVFKHNTVALISLLAGENVQEFAFRIVSLTFDAAVLRELDVTSAAPQRQIGSISKFLKLQIRCFFSEPSLQRQHLFPKTLPL